MGRPRTQAGRVPEMARKAARVLQVRGQEEERVGPGVPARALVQNSRFA
jgi:hypothetical protein